MYLLDGTFIASGEVDFWDGSHEAGMNVDQFGVSQLFATPWTGFDQFGYSLYSIGGPDSLYGDALQSTGIWAVWGLSLSDRFNSIYAVSETLTVVPEPTTFGTCVLISGVGTMVRFGRRRRERPSVASQV